MMIAELSMGEAPAIGWLFVIVASVSLGANEIMRFVDRFKTKPPVDEQVRRVQEEAKRDYATKADLDHSAELFDQRVDTLTKETTRLISIVEANEDRQECRNIALHQRIDSALSVSSAIQRDLARHSGQLRMSKPEGSRG